MSSEDKQRTWQPTNIHQVGAGERRDPWAVLPLYAGPTALYPDNRCLMHSTEIGLSQSLQCGDGDLTAPRADNSGPVDSLNRNALSKTAQQSSHYFLATQSIQRKLCEMVRMMNSSEAEEILLTRFAQMQEQVTGELLDLRGKKRSFSGSIVSSNLPLVVWPTRKRIKSSSKRYAKSKESQRKKYPVKLTAASIINVSTLSQK